MTYFHKIWINSSIPCSPWNLVNWPAGWLLESCLVTLCDRHECACIELHVPTNATQKVKLLRRDGQFTYTSNTPPHLQALSSLNVAAAVILFNHTRQDSNSRPIFDCILSWMHQLIQPKILNWWEKGGQFTYTWTLDALILCRIERSK